MISINIGIAWSPARVRELEMFVVKNYEPTGLPSGPYTNHSQPSDYGTISFIWGLRLRSICIGLRYNRNALPHHYNKDPQ